MPMELRSLDKLARTEAERSLTRSRHWRHLPRARPTEQSIPPVISGPGRLDWLRPSFHRPPVSEVDSWRGSFVFKLNLTGWRYVILARVCRDDRPSLIVNYSLFSFQNTWHAGCSLSARWIRWCLQSRSRRPETSRVINGGASKDWFALLNVKISGFFRGHVAHDTFRRPLTHRPFRQGRPMLHRWSTDPTKGSEKTCLMT
jgi:hypothetical protein